MTTLAFLHGWGASGHIWQRQVKRFGGEGRGPAAAHGVLRVLAPSLPVWEHRWLGDFLRSLPLQDCVLVGWSLGGMLLLETLARTPCPPPGGLVLVGVAPVFCRQPDHPWGQPPAVVRAMRRAINSDPHQVLEDFAHQCLAPGEGSFRSMAAAAFGSPPPPENLAAGLDYLLRQDLRAHFSRIPPGALIIQGEEDAIVPPAQAHFLQEHLPGAKLHLIPGAGHLPFLTQAEVFNGILREHLQGSGA